MLVQSFRREVPDHDAFFGRTILRHERFSIAVLRSRGIANDYGLLMRAVTYLLRFRRSQLVLLLAGRGYFDAGGRRIALTPGHVIESDQLRGEAERYAGTPCELLVLEWDEGHLFGQDTRGDARISRIAPRDVARLRAHVAELGSMPADRWVVELCRRIGSLGVALASDLDSRALAGVREPLSQAYGALGDTLARLDVQPSLVELADAMRLSERQTNRHLIELERTYGHPFEGWRDFIHENRVEWALQLLSIPGIPLARVARLAGYRSTVARCHAFSSRGAQPPSAVAARLAEQWR